jgi:phosphoserine aminotransferase
MTDFIAVPARKPARPHFSSGPCAKPPGYSPAKLATEALGRSHRAKIGKTRLAYAIDLMREVLQLPDTHRIGIVPGSDTGAFEMAMWTMLGARGVTTVAWESFGEGWVTDAAKQLKLDPTVIRADYGQLPDLTQVDWNTDVLFTWNGTSRPTGRAYPSPTRLRRCSLTTSTGRRSTSPPSPGRRSWAARAATAC